VRIFGLISWYEESPLWLAATTASAAKLCDHIVAVDGAYGLFPDGRERSGPEQAAAIQEVCAANGMGCSTHTPQFRWMGNEVEKRSFMFSAAELLADPGDWFIILDADEVIYHVPADLRTRLEATELDVGEVTFREIEDFDHEPRKAEQARKFDFPRENTYPIRTVFRSGLGLRVEGNHYTYIDRNGRILWGNQVQREQEPCLDLTDLVVDHRTHLREINRRGRAKRYYQIRDSAEIEFHGCFLCKDRKGTKAVKAEPRKVDGVLEASQVLVCEECFLKAKAASDLAIRQLGFNPDTLLYEGVAA
jgi:hypothetical protein